MPSDVESQKLYTPRKFSDFTLNLIFGKLVNYYLRHRFSEQRETPHVSFTARFLSKKRKIRLSRIRGSTELSSPITKRVEQRPETHS